MVMVLAEVLQVQVADEDKPETVQVQVDELIMVKSLGNVSSIVYVDATA